MAYRESNNISRPDIINQVLKAKKNGFRYHERDVDQKLTEGLKGNYFLDKIKLNAMGNTKSSC